jgi:hypothetical protein
MSAEVSTDAPQVPQQVREQARQAGGGWLDEVVGDHDLSRAIPTTAIKGSWRLDANGDLTGEYVANPAYTGRPQSRGCPLHRR